MEHQPAPRTEHTVVVNWVRIHVRSQHPISVTEARGLAVRHYLDDMRARRFRECLG